MAVKAIFFWVTGVPFLNTRELESSDDTTKSTSETSPETSPETLAGSTTNTTAAWRERVARMAAEVAAREGCEIYDLDFVGGGGSRALRIVIDKAPVTHAADEKLNVSIEDCSNVSRGLNLLLDVDDVIPGGAYDLEVSSPGLERPLRTIRHYQRAKGKRAYVKTFESFAELDSSLGEEARAKLGRAKQLEGVIVDVEAPEGAETSDPGSFLVFDAENGAQVIRVRLPLAKVTKANTVFIFESNEKPSGGKKKKN